MEIVILSLSDTYLVGQLAPLLRATMVVAQALHLVRLGARVQHLGHVTHPVAESLRPGCVVCHHCAGRRDAP